MKKFILFVVIIAAAGGGYYYYNFSNTQVSTTSYEYIKVEKGNIKKTVSATGKIIPTSTLTLSSEISGKIVEINKDFNEQIKICLLYTSPSPRDQRGSGLAACG